MRGATTTTASPRGSIGDPTQAEILALSIFTLVFFMVSVSCFTKFSNFFGVVDNFGDSPAYISIASAIRHWDFHGVDVKQFWGLPYAMAAISTVTRISDHASLLLVCLLSSVFGVALAYRLWGSWVAGFFAVLNFDWMQRSCLGGAEPLFVALLFAAFLAVRREKWLLAATLASLSTVVRPLGFLALLAIGTTLLWRREFRKGALATFIGLVIGGLYILPLSLYVGAPWANVARYQRTDWEGGHLIGLPFYAILKGTFTHPRPPWTNLVLTFGWIFLVLAGIVAMLATRRFREYARGHPVEVIFAATYMAFLYTYDSPYWARGSFPRFAIPIIPVVVFSLLPWIPRSRRLLWGLGIVSPILAGASAIGIRNVLHMIHS